MFLSLEDLYIDQGEYLLKYKYFTMESQKVNFSYEDGHFVLSVDLMAVSSIGNL